MHSLLVLSGLLLFVIYTTSTFDYFSPELHNDYFFPRSGDLLIFSNDQPEPFKARVVSSNVDYALKEKFIDDVAVADYFGHINGLGVFNEKSNRDGFPSVSYFEKPRAELIFVLDDIDQAAHLELVSNGVSAEVSTTTSKLSTPLSFLTTLFSGSSVSEHGIIDSKWWDNIFGTYVTAYSRDLTTKVSGEAFKANLASLFSWTTDGQSLVATYGSDYSVGATLAPHSKIVSSPSNVYSAYYLHDRKTAGSIHPRDVSSWMKEKEILSVERLRKVFSEPKFSFSEDQNENTITVSMDSLQVVFNLNAQNDSEFFAQFNIINVLLSAIEEQETLLLSDNVPDLFSFYLSGLKSCKGDKNKMMIVRELINSFTLFVKSKVEKFYSDQSTARVATHFVLVEAHGRCPMEMKQRSELAQLLRTELGSHLSNEDDLEGTLPHVYLLPSLTVPQINLMYFQLEAIFRNTEFRVVSPIDPLMNTFGFRDESSNSTDSDDDSDTVVVQTALWSSVALAVGVIMAVYFICCMDTGQDTIIYRPVPHMHKA